MLDQRKLKRETFVECSVRMFVSSWCPCTRCPSRYQDDWGHLSVSLPAHQSQFTHQFSQVYQVCSGLPPLWCRENEPVGFTSSFLSFILTCPQSTFRTPKQQTRSFHSFVDCLLSVLKLKVVKHHFQNVAAMLEWRSAVAACCRVSGSYPWRTHQSDRLLSLRTLWISSGWLALLWVGRRTAELQATVPRQAQLSSGLRSFQGNCSFLGTTAINILSYF